MNQRQAMALKRPFLKMGRLHIPARTMSFIAAPSGEGEDDLDGLRALAQSDYGDPQRLAIRHVRYDSAPTDEYVTSVYAFTGRTAIALAKSQWEWFADGNSGDAKTEPKQWGDVMCALHDQGGGLTHAECWRWDHRVAVVVNAIVFPTGSERHIAPAIEDLFTKVAESV